MNTLPFEIKTGPNDAGWCAFGVRLGEASLECSASYIAQHPLHPLILSVVGLYHHFFEDTDLTEGKKWDSSAADEPGGIVVRAFPQDGQLWIQVFEYDGEPLHPDPDKLPHILPSEEGYVDFWHYAESVFEAAARAICRQGITGFCHTWDYTAWQLGYSEAVFPVEPFLYVAALVKHRRPVERMSLSEELALLQEIMDRFGGEEPVAGMG